MQRTLLARTSSVLLAALFGCSFTGKAQFSNPESVEYDPLGDRYFVSNTGSHLMRSRDQMGAVTTFVNVGAAPYGLEVLNGVLYACVGGGIKGYSLEDASLQFEISLGGSFMNGITTDGEFLYATDFSAGRIYKVDVTAASSSVLVSNTNGTPNGIVWDPIGERLVVVFWGNNAAIKAFDRTTGASQTLVANTGLGNIDGVTIDCLGNFLVILGANTLTATAASLTLGQTNAFTGITGSDPTATITGGGVNICNGASVNLNTNVTGAPSFTYSWSPATGLSATNIANAVASPSITTAYTVTIRDGNGIVDTDNTTITVNPATPTPTIVDKWEYCM